MKTYLAISIAITLVVSIAAIASDYDEEVVVTANKIEQSLAATLPTVSLITALDIQNMQISDLPSLLGRVSGIGFRDSGGRGSVSGIFVRGTTSSQVVVLIDGVRSASADAGATALENIPLEAIDHIEIVKGPLSGLYGADALGGVIQVFTKTAVDTGLGGSMNVVMGSHQSRDYTLSLSAASTTQQFFASFSREDTRGIDRTEFDMNGNGDRDGFKQKSGHLSASFALSEQLKAQLNYLKSEGKVEFDNVFGCGACPFSESESGLETVGARLLYQPSDAINLSLNMGYLSDLLTGQSRFGGPYSNQTRRRSLALQGDFQVGQHLLTFGADYRNDHVSTLSNFPETERDNQGYFMQWQASFGVISLVSSLRYDDNEIYGNDSNGSVAVSWHFRHDLALVASYGTAFRAPTFNELYFPFYGNPDVLPEESESYELSLRGVHGGYHWRLSTYRTEVDNLIGFNSATFVAGNIASATLEGLELELEKQFDNWSFSGNVDYLEARDEKTNEYLDDRAVLSGNVRLGRSFRSLYVGVDIKAEHGRHDNRGLALPGFAIWGMSAVYDISNNFQVSGRLDNLFDKDYILNMAGNDVAYATEGLAGKLSVTYKFR